MVKVRQLYLVGFFLLGSTACAGRQKAADGMIPVAKAITIYSAGGSVVSGVIDSAALGARRLRLPATVAAITLSQGDQSVKWFTVQAVPETKKDPTHKLIGLPGLNPGELKFNYGLPDITWALQLKPDIGDGMSAI